MMRALSIAPITAPAVGAKYDLLFSTLGYEERARYLVESRQIQATRKLAWEFGSNQVLSFDDNRKFFQGAGFECVGDSDGRPACWIAEAFRNLAEEADRVSVCLDVSSMSRYRLALWLDAIMADASSELPIQVDFMYSAAKFVPPVDIVAPNVSAGPVTPHFAGWSTDPSLPSVLIVGLGYEPDRAIGAVEFIEPKEVIAFEPISSEPRFSPAIAVANSQLWGLRPKPRRVCYQVEHPYATVILLDGIVGRLAQRSRPVLLPFGPKIFALSAMLVAKLHKAVSVWRVSAGPGETPIQRCPSGDIVGLRVLFTMR